MNCKPGDLAIFVGGVLDRKETDCCLGYVFKCIAPMPVNGCPGWSVELVKAPKELIDALSRQWPGFPIGEYITGVADVALRPIRGDELAIEEDVAELIGS